MGNGMNKVLPGLFVGNFRDAKDLQQLEDNKITHVLAIHDNAKKLHDDKEYLCIVASDNSEQELMQYFPECIDFIHKARLNDGGVLVHCLAGVSRSVTITAAYIMTITPLSWREALNCIRGVRNGANPNFNFQKQLQKYQNEGLDQARETIRNKYPESDFDGDHKECQANLKAFQQFVLHGSPNKDDGLYPLPYNAYKGQNNPSEQRKSENKGDNSGADNNESTDNQSNRKKTVDFDKLSNEVGDM